MLKHSVQRVVGRGGDAGDAQAAIERMSVEGKKLIRAGELVTTPEAVEREKATIAAMRRGQGTQEPALSAREAQAAVERRNAGRLAQGEPEFTPGQAEAVRAVLTSRDRVTAIEGRAGAGKTTALAAIREEYEGRGFVVRGAAQSASAAGVLEREAGIKSQTLASHLLEERQTGKGARGKDGKEVWVIDEASLIGTREMRDLLERGEAARARVVLVGDSHQMRAVEAGQPGAQLQKNGMETAKMGEIVRQRDPALREAVREAARGEAGKSFDTLDRQGRVTEIGDREARIEAVARDYLSRTPEERAGTLVLTGRNEDRRELNAKIRAGLTAEGALRGEKVEAQVLIKKDLTRTQAREAEHYAPGDQVRFGRAYERLGIRKGEYAIVQKIDPTANRLTVRTEGGKEVSYDPRRFQKTEAYQAETRAIRAGEKLFFTRNDHERGRRNGETATVTSVDPDKREAEIVTARGERQKLKLDTEKHFEHGYASTVHAAQGRTSEKVLYNLDSRSLTASRAAEYVAISRARTDARIYTDDRTQAREALTRPGRETSAMETARKAAIERAGDSPAKAKPQKSHDIGRDRGREIGRGR